MAISFLHEIFAQEDDLYCGETWAETADEELGHVKWHADGNTTFIDYIETDGRTPLLGVRLLKAVWDHEKQNIDPGMTNEDGKRLWRLFRARYSY